MNQRMYTQIKTLRKGEAVKECKLRIKAKNVCTDKNIAEGRGSERMQASY